MENINRFYMIDDMLSNKKLNSIMNELFIRGTELNISLTFITQSYFTFPNIVRLNSTHDIIMKIPNKRELQQIVYNQLSDIDSKGFMDFYKKYTAKPYSILFIGAATLALDNLSSFTKNTLERI